MKLATVVLALVMLLISVETYAYRDAAAFTSEQRLAFVVEGLQASDNGASVCEKNGISPNEYAQWRSQFFASKSVLLASAGKIFADKSATTQSGEAKRIARKNDTFESAAPGNDMRIEVGVGGAYGGGSASGNDNNGRWKVANAGTGIGLAAGIQLWKDRALGYEWLSVGSEYEYNHYDVALSEREGRETVHAFADLHLLLLNVAIRNTVHRYSPYLGVGLGALYYEGNLSAKRSYLDSGTSSGFAPIAQVFAGVDYDITDSIYGGVETKFGYFYVKSHGVDVQYHKMDTLLKLGMKF